MPRKLLRRRPATKRRSYRKRPYRPAVAPGRNWLGLSGMPAGYSHGWSNYRTNAPFRPIMFTKNAYTEIINFTSGASGIFGTEQVYFLNNMYDPNFTGVGHQPYGRDTLASIYNRYKVTGVTMDITYSNPSSDSLMCAMQISPPSQTQTLTGQSIPQALEKQNVRGKILNTTGAQKVHMSFYFPMHELVQCTKLQYKADMSSFSSDVGAGPNEQPALRLAVADGSGGSGVTCVAAIKLVFHCMWYDRVQLSQS